MHPPLTTGCYFTLIANRTVAESCGHRIAPLIFPRRNRKGANVASEQRSLSTIG